MYYKLVCLPPRMKALKPGNFCLFWEPLYLQETEVSAHKHLKKSGMILISTLLVNILPLSGF